MILRRILSGKGQATVELALILPVLLMITLVVIDMARAFSSLQVVTNAAREGARVAIIPTTPPATVTATVNAYLAPSGQAGCVTVGTFWGTNGAAGDTTTVNVTCPFQTITGGLLQGLLQILTVGQVPGWNGTIQLPAVVTMRHE